MKRISMKQLRTLANKLGATLDNDESTARPGHLYEIRAEAPPGYHWRCEAGIHELISTQVESSLPFGPDSPNAIRADLYERMAMGVEPCNITCEWWLKECTKGAAS